MTKKLDLPLILLAIAGFLAPLIGGQVSVDALGLDPSESPFLSAITGKPETPILSHTILALLCSSALIVLLMQRKIMQVPNNTFTGLILGLLAVITASVGISSYHSASIPAGIEWLTYGSALYAVVAGTGRRQGPMVLISSIFGGCVLLALLGMREYGQMKTIDPTWRIFPQWVGPNAIAAILVVGFFLGLSLAAVVEQLATIGIGVGCVAIGSAVFLTQSKGALLALVIGLVLYAILILIWLPRARLKRTLSIAVACFAVVGVLAVAISKQPAANAQTKSSGSPLGRIANAGATSDQSVGFRKLLWQSAIKLIEQNPMGTGIGTFEYESAKPGLVTQTRLAHETYLQLAEEASVFALLFFLAALGWWTRLVFKAGKSLTESQIILRAGVVAAVASVLIHSFIDSDLSYYGIGLIVFMLLGVGLLLSTDAVAPEFLPPMLRRISAGGIAILTLLLGFLGVTEAQRAQVRGTVSAAEKLMAEGKQSEAASLIGDAQTQLESIRSSAPWDADAWNLSALTAKTTQDQIKFAQKAVELSPTTHTLRQLARAQNQAGMFADATSTLQRAITLDPNNLSALSMLEGIQRKAGFTDEANATLKKIVAVEETPYFKVRSLTELVVTDTYSARVKLAEITTDPKEKIKWLQPAVDGFKQYVNLTLPNVIKFSKNPDGQLDYAGQTAEIAQTKMKQAQQAAKDLAAAYRAVGDPGKAADADEDAGFFGKAADPSSFK